MYTYIIIDDERLIRLGLISKIKEITTESFECVGQAANGLEGLNLIEQASPDIVITDMKMAKMDGVVFLEKLSQAYPGIPVIVISGYKAYDYMNEAIERGVIGYVLKPFSTEEIEKQLLKAAAKVEQQKSVAMMQQKMDFYDVQMEENKFLKVILDPWDPESGYDLSFGLNRWHILITLYSRESDLILLMRKYQRIVFEKGIILCLENPGGNGQYFVLFSAEDEREIRKHEVRIPEFLKDLQRKIGNNKLYAAVSSVYQGIQETPQYYTSNEKMLRDIHLDEKVCFLYQSIYKKECRTIVSEEEIKDLMVGIKYGNDRKEEQIRRFFEKFDIHRDSLLEIGNACKKFLAQVDEWAVKNQVGTDDIMSVFYRRYRYSEDLEKMRKEISGYVHLIALSIERKSYSDDYLYEEMIRYIQENYYKKITLQTLADQFYCSGAQCSSLLKSRLNRGLNAYLTDLRIKRAKELLDQTNMSVENISSEIGYPNPKYFFRIFKQTTTFTPIEYRNRRRDV